MSSSLASRLDLTPSLCWTFANCWGSSGEGSVGVGGLRILSAGGDVGVSADSIDGVAASLGGGQRAVVNQLTKVMWFRGLVVR